MNDKQIEVLLSEEVATGRLQVDEHGRYSLTDSGFSFVAEVRILKIFDLFPKRGFTFGSLVAISKLEEKFILAALRKLIERGELIVGRIFLDSLQTKSFPFVANPKNFGCAELMITPEESSAPDRYDRKLQEFQLH